MAAAAMEDHLDQTLGVPEQLTRERIVDNGFHSLEGLIRRQTDFARKVCTAVRKTTGGAAAARLVSLSTEGDLANLILYAKYVYIIQRPINFDEADLNTLDALGYWFGDLKRSNPTTHKLTPFSDGANKKIWFESILSHFQIMIGESGVPLVYVLREVPGLPAVDPGLGMPTFEEEVSARGRHDGHFWRGDNRLVWLLIKELTEGPMPGVQSSLLEGPTMTEELTLL